MNPLVELPLSLLLLGLAVQPPKAVDPFRPVATVHPQNIVISSTGWFENTAKASNTPNPLP